MTERKIAIHEAGHAAIMWDLGFKVSEASIVPDGDILGVVKELRHRDSEDMTRYRDQYYLYVAIVYMAGAAAEKHADPEMGFSTGARHDLEKVQAAIEELASFSGTAKEAMRKYIWERTMWEVQQRWQKVVAIADALEEKKTLSGDEVAEIMCDA